MLSSLTCVGVAWQQPSKGGGPLVRLVQQQYRQARDLVRTSKQAVGTAQQRQAAARERTMLSQALLTSAAPHSPAYRRVMAKLLGALDTACYGRGVSPLRTAYCLDGCVDPETQQPWCMLKTPSRHRCELDWLLEMLIVGTFPLIHTSLVTQDSNVSAVPSEGHCRTPKRRQPRLQRDDNAAILKLKVR